MKLNRADVQTIVQAQGIAPQPVNETATMLRGRPRQSKNHGKERDLPIDYVKTGNLRGFFNPRRNKPGPVVSVIPD